MSSLRRREGILLCSLLVFLGSALAGAPQTGQGYKDGVYSVSLDVIRKELAEAGKFPAPSESPSLYLSDFFGLQRIKDVPAADILKNFAPAGATAVAKGPVPSLRLPNGYTVSFYIHCPIVIDGNPNGVPLSFIEVSDFHPTFKDRYAALSDFLQLLEKMALNNKYLVRNPYAALEKKAAIDLKSETRPRPQGWPQLTPEERAAEKVRMLAGYERARRGILLFGDTHGSEESYAAVWDYLTARPSSPPRIDWIGLEMLTRDQQPLLDDFLLRPDGSPEFRAAESKLQDYFRGSWDKRFAQPGDPGEGHYYRIVRWARLHKVRVYALDAPWEYTLFRYGEFPLGATVRNMIWAEVVPLKGKGLIYGGSAHFVALPTTPFTFQDYIKRRHPQTRLFLVR